MGRKLHFFNTIMQRIACGEPLPKQNNTRTGRNQHRSPKYTTNPAEVTCERCKDRLIGESQHFMCPMCSEITKTFIITEIMPKEYITDGEQNTITEVDKIAQRNLVSITCPICNNTQPVNESWRNISDKMKLGGYISAQLTYDAHEVQHLSFDTENSR